MLNRKKGYLLMLGLAAGFFTFGCGQKRIDSTEMQKDQEEANRTAQMAAGHYLVQKHDCLWTIASKSKIYGDAFQWPELFKANRDEIKDPDLIYPRQDLKVEKGLSETEVDSARKLALSTPKYVPHSSPRASLPVDYF